MKTVASLFLAASFTLISSSSFASGLEYACKNINNVDQVQTLTLESNLLLPNKIGWTNAQGYKYKFPGKTTPAVGLDFGFKGHVFESTSMNHIFLGVYFQQTLYIDSAILDGGDTGIVLEVSSYGSMPENSTDSVVTFECSIQTE